MLDIVIQGRGRYAGVWWADPGAEGRRGSHARARGVGGRSVQRAAGDGAVSRSALIATLLVVTATAILFAVSVPTSSAAPTGRRPSARARRSGAVRGRAPRRAPARRRRSWWQPAADSLQLASDDLPWVVTAYRWTSGGGLLLGARIADLLPRKRVFLTGTAAITVASLLSGFAGSAGELAAARATQGLGAALTPADRSICCRCGRAGRPRRCQARGTPRPGPGAARRGRSRSPATARRGCW